MYDERIRRGPALSKTTPRATAFEIGMAESLASQAETRAAAAAGRGGSLRTHGTVASFEAQLGLPPAQRLLALSASASLDVTARKRGPNAFDFRAGSQPREEVDVSGFLVEAAAPRATAEAGSQGDAILGGDSAPGALTGATRVHHKTGVDAAAQVEHGSTRWQARPRFAGVAESSSDIASASGAAPLFDFDAAADALVSGLSERILEQGALEVEHERELLSLARRREAVQASLDADAANARRLEEEAAQRLARRSALKAQAQAEYARAEAALAKVAAQALARSMIEGRGGAVPVAIGQLHGEGFFVDPAEAMVRADVLPDLYASLAAATSQRADAAALVDGLLTDAAAAARAKAEAEAAAAAKEKAELTKNCACGSRRARGIRRSDPASHVYPHSPSLSMQTSSRSMCACRAAPKTWPRTARCRRARAPSWTGATTWSPSRSWTRATATATSARLSWAPCPWRALTSSAPSRRVCTSGCCCTTTATRGASFSWPAGPRRR